MVKLRTTSEVIDALGGIRALSELTRTSINGIYNWRAVGQFPADTYIVIREALGEIGKSAPDHLWPMRQAPKKAARR